MSVDDDRISKFEEAVLPHLDSAHNLARWLTGNDADAGDVVQEACVRALRHFDGFRGGDVKPWFLTVVRNSAYTFLGARPKTAELDEESPSGESLESALVRADERESVGRALEALPPEFRETIVLRELEGLSYKEIAAVTETPIGTVMSRLSRGRELLFKRLGEGAKS